MHLVMWPSEGVGVNTGPDIDLKFKPSLLKHYGFLSYKAIAPLSCCTCKFDPSL